MGKKKLQQRHNPQTANKSSPPFLFLFFRLQFNFGHASFLLVTIAPHGTLHLDFYTDMNESLGEIGWRMKTEPFSTPLPHGPSNFISSLHLISVTDLTSETVSSLLSKFQLLQSLIIKDCSGLHSLHIDANHCLSELTISNCFQPTSLHIKAFRINNLCIRGLLPKFISECVYYHMEDVMLRGGPTDNRSL